MNDVWPHEEAGLRQVLHAAADQVSGASADLYPLVVEGARRRHRRSSRAAHLVMAGIVVVIAGATAVMVLPRSQGDQAQLAIPAQTASCPATLADWKRGPLRTGTDQAFVPMAPTSATICRYASSATAAPITQGEPASMTLASFGPLTGTALTDLVEALNAAPEGHMRCPRNPSVVVLVRFHYATDPDVEVNMGVAGCWNASNGVRSAMVWGIGIPGFVGPATTPVGPDETATSSGTSSPHPRR